MKVCVGNGGMDPAKEKKMKKEAHTWNDILAFISYCSSTAQTHLFNPSLSVYYYYYYFYYYTQHTQSLLNSFIKVFIAAAYNDFIVNDIQAKSSIIRLIDMISLTWAAGPLNGTR